MRLSVPALLLVGLALLGSGRARAQEAAPGDTASPPPADRTATRPWAHPAFIGLRLATAQHSPFSTRLDRKAYRDFYEVELRAGWTLAAGEHVAVEYAASLVPLAIMTGNPDYVPASALDGPDGLPIDPCPADGCTDGTGGGLGVVLVPRTVYAFGLAPLGFQLRFRRHARVQFIAHLAGGGLWFTRPVPDPAAAQFNFTAELGGAIEIALPGHHGLLLGYTFHHTSNGGTGTVNPGLNSHLITLGVAAHRTR